MIRVTDEVSIELPKFPSLSNLGIFSQLFIFTGGSDGKEPACNAEDPGSLPRLGRFPGEGHESSHQYSCVGHPMDRGTWQATVHGVVQSQTRLSD